MTPEEQIARARQAEAALDQFLAPAIDVLMASYSVRLQEIAVAEPWATDKIRKLATALKIAREVQGQIVGVVKSGDVARDQKRRADEIAGMSDERRRWALAGGMR